MSAVALVAAADTSAVTPGEWSHCWSNCVAYADAHELPLVLIWGNEGCTHCAELASAVQTDAFTDWMGTDGSEIVYCMVEGLNGVDRSDEPWNSKAYKGFNGAKDFASRAAGTLRQALNGYPYVCLYQPYLRGSEWEAVGFVGRESTMGGGSGSLAERMISRIEDFLENRRPPSCSAGFPMGMTENDRLEAVVGQTDHIWVPVRRLDEPTFESTTALTLDLGSSQVTSNVVWSLGVTDRHVRFELPTAGRAAGDVLRLTLKTASGVVLATNAITYVEEPENSPKNPLFVGERTATSLGWGEWTMDLDAATQKVAAVSGAATLVLVGGSLWCPDCYSTDRYLIDTAAFKTWARDNKIACVAVDVTNPKSDTMNTSLLSWDAYDTCKGNPDNRDYQRYVTCNYGEDPDFSLRFESGAGYLSRHGIDPESAAEVAARNRRLMMTSTREGGLCRPEEVVATNNAQSALYCFKTGIPCLIALRPDGTIAGRIYQFNNTSAQSEKDLAAHIQRLKEMFDQVSRPEEEDNDHWRTTGETLSSTARPSVSATLSAVDGQDVYRLADAPYTRAVLSLTGSASASVILRVTDEAGSVSRTLGEATGDLAEGVTVTARLSSAACYVKVTFPKDGDGYATGDAFAFTNEASTVRGYALSVSGRMSGGEIGFALPADEVSETVGSVAIPVVRSSGSGGSASVRVSLVRTPEALDALASGRISWTDRVVSWADGESGPSGVPPTLTVADDEDPLEDLTLEFALDELTGSSEDVTFAAGATAYRLTITDDDGTAVLLRKGVAAELTQPVDGWQSGDVVVFSKLSGSLASGLAVSFADGVLTAAGTPRRTGNTLAVYRVKVFRAGVCVSTQDVTFELSVRAADFASVVPGLTETLTFRNLPVTETDCSACGSDERRLSGLLTVTVPPDGRATAKLVFGTETCAYAADGWTSYGRQQGLGTVLKGVDDPEDAIRLQLTAETLKLTAAGFTNTLALTRWKAAGAAEPWRGQYAVQMPQMDATDSAGTPMLTGDGYMALRMASDAAVSNACMLYAGVLPNGRGFYGSSVLVERDDGRVDVPFLAASSDAFSAHRASGVLAVSAVADGKLWAVRASDDILSKWCVSNAVNAHDAAFRVYGGFYDMDSVLTKFYENYGTRANSLAFKAGADDVRVALEMTEDGPVVKAGEDNAAGVELTFWPVTGVVSGCLATEGAGGILFRGIVLPGWQDCEDCSGEDFVERPWATGAAAYDAAGGSRVRDGFGISLGCD